MKKEYRRVEVTWVDSNCLHGWQEPEVKTEIAEVSSLGFLISEEESKLTLAPSVSEYGLIFNPIAIPKGCIKSIKELRLR